jgi:hypothetical protein
LNQGALGPLTTEMTLGHPILISATLLWLGRSAHDEHRTWEKDAMKLELLLDGEVVIKMELTGLFSQLIQSKSTLEASARSAPLTRAQATALLKRVDEKSVTFLKKIAENDGWISWGEVKHIFDVTDWVAFSNTLKKGITRELRDILHSKSAQLVWRNEDEWQGLEEGEDDVCMVHVDGAALRALREASGDE